MEDLLPASSPGFHPTYHGASAREYARNNLDDDEVYRHSRGMRKPFFAYPPDNPLVFVKFGGLDVQAEADTQRLAFDWLSRAREARGCNIYIPEVFKTFERNQKVFVVMELLDAKTVRQLAVQSGPQNWLEQQTEYYEMMVEGIQLLRQMPVPEDAKPGPYTKSRRIIKHEVFKEQEAPIEYDTTEELEGHLNRVAAIAYRKDPSPPTVKLERELVFCYTDFNSENFMFRKDGAGRTILYIVDFEHASFLPLSFLAYSILDPKARFPLSRWLAAKMGSQLPAGNLEVMRRICYIFQVSWSKVGLKAPEKH